MPSSSVGFSFGFICGQLGGALYLSFHHIKIQNASGRGLILTTEFSIPTLVAVILSILAVDGLVLIFYRYLCTSAKHQPNGALKFKAATSSARHFRLLATVFSVPSSFSRWRVVHRPTLAPATVLPLVENPTSLTPATETVSPPLQPVSLAAGHSGVQDSSNEDANICRHDIKQEAEQKIDTDTEDNLARSSRKHERIEASPAKAVPVVRHSHALLLLHVAAAAQMRRKLQAKVVVEPCHTKIVEDAEEVEKIGEKIGEIVKDVEDLAKEVVADSMKTLVVETFSTASLPTRNLLKTRPWNHYSNRVHLRLSTWSTGPRRSRFSQLALVPVSSPAAPESHGSLFSLASSLAWRTPFLLDLSAQVPVPPTPTVFYHLHTAVHTIKIQDERRTSHRIGTPTSMQLVNAN
ncbi:hypothetical protein K438DRAFT_998924 [Mycena galopus ATCC 62051]|nr:hypothetical protein K438DRAFT_998924 [Mycena galopus ATCC 62051]